MMAALLSLTWITGVMSAGLINTAEDCGVQLPSGKVLNFEPLKARDSDWWGQIGDTKRIFNIHVCKSAYECPQRPEANVCEWDATTQPKQFLDGVSTWQGEWSLIDPVDENKGVRFTTQGGDECRNKAGEVVPRKTEFDFLCSPVTVEIISVEEVEDCWLRIPIRSPHACLAPPVKECGMKLASGQVLDFAPLKTRRTDWWGQIIATKRILNIRVCGPAKSCPQRPDASVCEWDAETAQPQFISGVSTWDGQWALIDAADAAKGVRFTTQGGDECRTKGGEVVPRKTEFDFLCAPVTVEIISVEEVEDCWLRIPIRSPHACLEPVPPQPEPEPTKPDEDKGWTTREIAWAVSAGGLALLALGLAVTLYRKRQKQTAILDYESLSA